MIAEEKRQQLARIAEEIEQCRHCQTGKEGQAVPGEGHPNAKIMLLGEAPGKQEAQTGRPFIGKAGEVLTDLLASIGVTRDEVFITSPVKYLPVQVTPTREEIVHGYVHTAKQLQVIEPHVVVLLGQSAIRAIFPQNNWKLTNIHGTTYYDEDAGVMYFFTYHPAAALRSPYTVRGKMEADFVVLQQMVD